MFILNSFYILVLLCSVCGKLRSLRKRDTVLPFGCPKIYIELHVSGVVAEDNLYKLKVIWANAPAAKGDWIGIFQTNPRTQKVRLEPLEIIPVYIESDYIETDVLEEVIKPENLGYEEKCLNYYAGYFDKCHNCFAVTCLRIEPDWMWKLKKKIGRKKIKNVVIPGTFQSTWYRDNYKNESGYTQRERVLGQLIYGTRYLQLRVSYQPDERHKFWATNYKHKLCPLHKIFDDIRTFLINTKEIVIVDFREFQSEFYDLRVHVRFINFLDSKLSDLAVPNTLNWDSTFNKVWYSGKQLIVCYNLPKVVSTYLWKPVEYKLSNAQTHKEVQQFFREVIKSPPKTAWAALARISANPENVTRTKTGSDEVSYQITLWFRNKVWLRHLNIVLVDFIKNKGIVKSAIEWNGGGCF